MKGLWYEEDYHVTEKQNWLGNLKLYLHSKVGTFFITFLNKVGLKAPTFLNRESTQQMSDLNFSGI